ncbi:MAG: hemerythrin domain-containing protein [Nitrospirae bacterium]|nr:hemerythrin domain-containing protein [Nitrospirota bacterium]
MMPVAPLMIEHRLTERMIALIQGELPAVRSGRVDTGFIRGAVDFFTYYVDLCHHGKEEEILFRGLAGKELSSGHRETMNQLIAEHILARTAVAKLDRAREQYLQGGAGAAEDIGASLAVMGRLYPAHIEKEDRHFFIPAMDYLGKDEQEAMVAAMEEFDRQLTGRIYRGMIERFENARKGIAR